MRRSDREVTEPSEINDIIKRCTICRLAFNDKVYPYILPLNFGFDETNQILYFHGAMEGTKYQLMEQNNHASFEMECNTVLKGRPEQAYCTMYFESVIGQGELFFVEEEEEKKNALNILLSHYYPEGFPLNEALVKNTRVFGLKINHTTAKRRYVKND